MKKSIGLVLILFSFSCQSRDKERENVKIIKKQIEPVNMNTKQYEIATLAGGCFWCTEAIFWS